MKNKTSVNGIVYRIIVFFLIVFDAIIFAVAYWGLKTYNLNLAPTVYSIFGNNEGMNTGIIKEAFLFCLPFIVGSALIAVAVVVCDRIWAKSSEKNGENSGTKIRAMRITSCVLAIMLFFGNMAYVSVGYGVYDFLSVKLQKTDIYQNEYIDPRNVKIEAENKRNVIVIYLESMETSAASKEEGGFCKDNYIPNLTRLAAENVSFSDKAYFPDSDKQLLGGVTQLNATNWTMATLFATSTGLPWAFKIGEDFEDGFAEGAYGMGDFLQEQDYNLEFLCGSDIKFAGRDKFFKSHGDYVIYDYNTAVERKVVNKDDFKWWGFDDKTLYDIAKNEIGELANKDEPFNFTMLTVDTHPIGGYECEHCPKIYDNKTANVIACADALLNEFIEWVQAQDFYENTTIVIIGDHLRSDTCIFKGVAQSDRRVYNCFINPAMSVDNDAKYNRIFTSLDLFPTILASMGYKIEGNRLGLGVNLFSGEQTLAEKMTFDALNKETEKRSEYFIKTFCRTYSK